MDISLNPRSNPTAVPTQTAGLAQTAHATSSPADRPALTVTEAHASGAAAVEAVPDSALDRDDALGRLFNAAFNLPPPPMPAFPT